MSLESFPDPQPGASLLLAFKSKHSALLIVGSSNIAAARAFAAIEADLEVIVAARGGLQSACHEIQYRVDKDHITFVDLDLALSDGTKMGEAIGRLLVEYHHISLACVTDTILLGDILQPYSFSFAKEIYDVCRRNRVPVNITDTPELCDFTFPVSLRFQEPQTGQSTPLQISVTTNGHGCRLATRLKREIHSCLPKTTGIAVQKIGRLRDIARATAGKVNEGTFDSAACASTPNMPPLPSLADSNLQAVRTRMQWIAQLSEFWPIEKLAQLTEGQMVEILNNPQPKIHSEGLEKRLPTRHSIHLSSAIERKGQIFLVGSGVGHPALLTVATHQVLTQQATFVLADKLVPSTILDLIPAHVQVIIARKFPGNADDAQTELMQKAIEAASQGQIVVRLKQGDPMVYGRAGEEILYCRTRGFEPTVIPGVSASIAGPTFGGIPVTQRGVAETFIVCTGVGRGGKEVKLPAYKREQTVIILMGVARLSQVVETLCAPQCSRRDGTVYPRHVPIAIIERASMADQRIVTSTLEHIKTYFGRAGEQRPPGMIVVGWSVLALSGEGDLDVLNDGASDYDLSRTAKWLGESRGKVCEGLTGFWQLPSDDG